MPLAPWLIVVQASITLYGLWRVSRLSYGWRVYVTMLIPFAFILAYGWVWVFGPQLERVSWIVRQVIFYSFGIADFIIFDILRHAGGNKRRYDDR